MRPNTGSSPSEKAATRELVSRLVAGLDPEAIWLFGSRTRGTHRPDSDFDLLVVTRTDDGEAGHDYDRAYAPICGLGIGVDIVPCREDDLEAELRQPSSMFADIVRTGLKLYDRGQSKALLQLADQEA